MEHVLTFMVLVTLVILACSLLILCILVLNFKDRAANCTKQGAAVTETEEKEKTEEEIAQEKAMQELSVGVSNLLSYDGTPQKNKNGG